MRWPSLLAGVVALLVAFFAATRVADTREGLIYEVVTLLSALVGVILVLVGLFARAMRTSRVATSAAVGHAAEPEIRSAGELLVGGGGLLVGLLLLIGLAVSAGPLWAGLGLALLLPMMTGCVYLCVRFVRAPRRDWRIDIGQLTGRR